MLTLALLTATAVADIAPPIPVGQQWVSYAVRFDNLAEHPDHALVVYDKGTELHHSRSFHRDGAAQQEIARGGNNRGQMGSPNVYLLPRTEFDAWSEATRTLIGEQETACADRNEGCAHISRFVPTYPPPAGAIDCGVQLDVVTETTEGGPDRIVDVYRIATATADTCALEKVTREHFRGETKLEGPVATTGPDTEARRCATVPAAVGGVWVVVALITRRRRR